MGSDRRPLDLLALDAAWVRAAVKRPVPGADGLPVVALPYLVPMKMESARMQDLADVSRMLGTATAADLRAVRRVMGRFRPQDREDLESLVRLGRLERVRAR